jgi:aromatic-L-amino-acid decarboxylase
VADRVADYLAGLETHGVLPDVEPGDVLRRLAAEPPAGPEPLDAILADYATWIEPNITHWQHPGFMAYFPSVASGPGILGEWLAAGLNSNVMFWRNAPASTEVEQTVVSWLRQMLGLPAAFDGMLTDTASISSLLALVAARHAAVPDSREQGLAGPDGPRLRMYASTEAHFSIEKAAIATGIGRASMRHVATDDVYAMRPDALREAIAEDRREGWRPFCVVGTLGTTSSNAIDPMRELAEICREERLWLHIDAAYAGAAAIVPEMRGLLAGWEGADSIVFNPHKWMFTPFDASLLLFREPEAFRAAFSVVPEYVRTGTEGVRNYNEYGIQMGRRFRALKLWIQIRYFGVDGIAARIREHCHMARELASWIEADPDWELLAPVPFATVCLRCRPRRLPARVDLDEANERLLAELNREGPLFLSHTRLDGRYTIRVALGNPRAGQRHVEQCWRLLRRAARKVGLLPGAEPER